MHVDCIVLLIHSVYIQSKVSENNPVIPHTQVHIAMHVSRMQRSILYHLVQPILLAFKLKFIIHATCYMLY